MSFAFAFLAPDGDDGMRVGDDVFGVPNVFRAVQGHARVCRVAGALEGIALTVMLDIHVAVRTGFGDVGEHLLPTFGSDAGLRHKGIWLSGGTGSHRSFLPQAHFDGRLLREHGKGQGRECYEDGSGAHEVLGSIATGGAAAMMRV